MTNGQIADILSAIGSILDIQGENPFKVRAYTNAARMISGLEKPLGAFVEDGTLGDLQGIGPALEEKLTELHRTGRMGYFEDLRKKVPAGVLDLLRVPALGPKKIKVLWKELDVTSVDALKKACESGKLLKLKGFGPKTQKNFLDAIARLSTQEGQASVVKVMLVALELLARLREHPAVKRAELCGSLRRGKIIVRDIDLLASSAKPREVIDSFAAGLTPENIIAKGDTKCSIRVANGLQADLRVVADDQFAPALQYFTGSKEHNVLVRQRAIKMGYSLNEYALTRGKKIMDCPSEEAIYRTLKLDFIPAELREGRDEIPLAENGKLPLLLEPEDVIGVLHVHSTWSDGTAEIAAMADKARRQGYSWMGLSDHSKAAFYANGLDVARLKKQMKEVEALNKTYKGFRILHGLECDILPDGNLDLTPEILKRLDFVIGSIHSRFDMPEQEMTDRICRAIENPNFDVLGHPTGRLLLGREGYKVDVEKVLQAAKAAGKVVELNAHPSRMDLDDVHIRRARELGVKVSIGPDAHSLRDLEMLAFGIRLARRAGIGPGDVVNSLPAEKVVAGFARP